jgi:hypothetical protein
MPVVKDLRHSDKEKDPYPPQSERSEPNSHRSKWSDLDPHESGRSDSDPHQRNRNTVARYISVSVENLSFCNRKVVQIATITVFVSFMYKKSFITVGTVQIFFSDCKCTYTIHNSHDTY